MSVVKNKFLCVFLFTFSSKLLQVTVTSHVKNIHVCNKYLNVTILFNSIPFQREMINIEE